MFFDGVGYKLKKQIIVFFTVVKLYSAFQLMLSSLILHLYWICLWVFKFTCGFAVRIRIAEWSLVPVGSCLGSMYSSVLFKKYKCRMPISRVLHLTAEAGIVPGVEILHWPSDCYC